MPAPVLVGTVLIMLGSIVASGVSQIKDAGMFVLRAGMIFSTSLPLVVGFELAPVSAFEHFPSLLTVLMELGVTIGGSTVIARNSILPEAGPAGRISEEKTAQ